MCAHQSFLSREEELYLIVKVNVNANNTEKTTDRIILCQLLLLLLGGMAVRLQQWGYYWWY